MSFISLKEGPGIRMTNKVEICIVYSPEHSQQPALAYENEKGKIWRHSQRIMGMNNIGMGFYSIPNPQPEDSILVVEPRCVLDRDYDIGFVAHYNKIFTWAIKFFENTPLANKIVEINHPSIQPVNPDEIRKSWLPWNEKVNEVVFVANNKSSAHASQIYSLRFDLAEIIATKSNIPVKWYGQSAMPTTYYAGTIPPGEKINVVKKSRFSVCTENCFDPIFSYGYFTEKLPEAWLAGTVPIYMGAYNIDNLNLPKNSYIDLRKYVKKSMFENGNYQYTTEYDGLLEEINSYDENKYNEMLNSIETNLRDPNGLQREVSWTRVYETMIDAFAGKE